VYGIVRGREGLRPHVGEQKICSSAAVGDVPPAEGSIHVVELFLEMWPSQLLVLLVHYLWLMFSKRYSRLFH
jgi:hypothetical protein